jgi:hypothetical protein
MTSPALRKKIHAYIDQADDSFLHIIHQLLEREFKLQGFSLTEEEIETSGRRRHELEAGLMQPVSHEQLMSDIDKALSKTKK